MSKNKSGVNLAIDLDYEKTNKKNEKNNNVDYELEKISLEKRNLPGGDEDFNLEEILDFGTKDSNSFKKETLINKMFQKDTRLSSLKRKLNPKKEYKNTSVNHIKSSTPKTLTHLVQNNNSSLVDLPNPHPRTKKPLLDNELYKNTKNSTIKNPILSSREKVTRSKIQKVGHTIQPSLFKKRKFDTKKVNDIIEEENSSEKDLEYYISYISNTRKFSRENDNKSSISDCNLKTQCPICHLFFPKVKLIEHASDCTGPRSDIGIEKKSISKAVIKEEEERRKRSFGIQEISPTNYYLDSDVLATDGSGLDSEITGTTWESAGQIRFS